MDELESMTQQNAALVDEGASAADSLRDQAGRLTQMVGDVSPDRATPPMKAQAVGCKPRSPSFQLDDARAVPASRTVAARIGLPHPTVSNVAVEAQVQAVCCLA
ncbi:MAG: hypothetical protein V9G23_12660 [Giesbergeria sp.]